MSKYITVASQYTIYEVDDEAFELLPSGLKMNPPQIVLETMALSGHVKRIGTVGTLTMNVEDAEEFFNQDNDEDPPEGSGPWLTEDNDE